jgi:hypothetical protein
MAAMGVRWVALMASVMQDSFASTRLYQDFIFTPGDDELERIIERFHQHGIRVLLKPMVECHDGAWRGEIRFPREGSEQIQGRRTGYWAAWFASLAASIEHYGRLAQRSGVELYCLGCELDSSQDKIDQWRELIRLARKVYRGPITYNSTYHAHQAGIPDDWFAELDIIGTSFYFPAADRPGASVDEMVAFLQPRVAQMRAIAQKYDRPLLFVETGTRAIVGAAVEHNYRLERPYDGEEQARYIEAVLKAFWDEPWWQGQYIWKWEEQQHRPQYQIDPAGDSGFTVLGKPAEQVLRRWYARDDRP